jgi:hypothetical protein
MISRSAVSCAEVESGSSGCSPGNSIGSSDLKKQAVWPYCIGDATLLTRVKQSLGELNY